MKKSILGWVALCALCGPARADVVTHISDDFSDGLRTKTGATDTNWWRTNGTLSVVSGQLEWASPGTFQAITGDVPTSTLVQAGDTIELTFNFRFAAAPGTQASGFRFGIYNQSGTAATDVAASTDNDKGYFANISTGATMAHQVRRETGATLPIIAGTDFTQIGANNTTSPGITGTLDQNASIKIIKTASGVNIVASVNGTEYLNVVDASPVTLTFDEVAFGSASNSQTLLFDNVVVTFSAVPEPSSLILVAAGGACLWTRRRFAFKKRRDSEAPVG